MNEDLNNFDNVLIIYQLILLSIKKITLSQVMEYIQIQQKLKTLMGLKHHVDCLLIRMNSCEQYLEKMFKIITDYGQWTNKVSYAVGINLQKHANSPDKTAKVICKHSACSIKQMQGALPSPTSQKQKVSNSTKATTSIGNILTAKGKKGKQRLKEQILVIENEHQQLQNLSSNYHQNACQYLDSPKLSEQIKINSGLRQLHMIPQNKSKDQKHKKLESQSFTLMKQAIIVNMHEIQKLEEKIDSLKEESQKKTTKLDSAIQLLTKVTKIIGDKLQNILLCQSQLSKEIKVKKNGGSSSKYSGKDQNRTFLL